MLISVDLYPMNEEYVAPFHSFDENVMDSGCYYLTAHICKDIVITAGASKIRTPSAIRMIHQKMKIVSEIMEDIIPAFRCLDNDIISCYAGELAECLVEAANSGKGIEITIGYPKALIFKVN